VPVFVPMGFDCKKGTCKKYIYLFVVSLARFVSNHAEGGWHKARGLEIPENMRILHLPPYSPELNPVEHLWDDLREKEFPNKVFGTMEMLELTLMHGLAKMENSLERVKSITGWPWIITVNLNAN